MFISVSVPVFVIQLILGSNVLFPCKSSATADIIDAVSFSSIVAFINRIDELFYSTSRQTTFEIFM